MKVMSNTQGKDVQMAFYVFIVCVLISFLQDSGELLSDGIVSIP